MSRPRANVNANDLERYLLTTPDYAAMRGWSPQSARKERLRGKGPPYIHIGDRVYYSITDIERHLREKGEEFRPYDPATETREQYLVRMNETLRR